MAVALQRTQDALLTIGEAASIAGVHRNTLRGWCASGRLPSVRVDLRSARRVRRSDLERLLLVDPPRGASRQEASIAAAQARPRRLRPLDGARTDATQRARSEVLRRIVAEVSGTLDPKRLFDDVLDSSRELFGTNVSGLWLLEPGDHPFRLAAHRELPPEMEAVVGSIRRDEPAVGLTAIEQRRPIVLDEPSAQATTPTLARLYSAPRVSHHLLRAADLPRGADGPPRAVPHDPVRLDRRGAGARGQLRQPDGDRRRERPALRLRQRAGGAPAGHRRAVQPPQSDHHGRRHRRGDRHRSRPAHRSRHHPRLPRRPDAPDVRADRVPGRVRRHRPAHARAASPARRPGADRLGRRARAQPAHRRCGRRPARRPGRRDGRPGIDARRPDVVRGPRPGRHRGVQARPQPVHRGRRADADDLRWLRGPGDVERGRVRAPRDPAGRAASPTREPAPPPRDQRAPALDPRSRPTSSRRSPTRC